MDVINSQQIAACYYPTQTVLLDDNPSFLQMFDFEHGQSVRHRGFTSPLQALQFMSKQPTLSQVLADCMHGQTEALLDDQLLMQVVDINLSPLRQHVQDTQRYDAVSVVLVDYAMPSMNGVEFCQQLLSHPSKKILVTGQADLDVAIKAFNDGVIDRFISKDDLDFAHKIRTMVADLKQAYFIDCSHHLMQNVTTNIVSCLKNKNFIEFLQVIFRRQNVTEYYLVDANGSLLLRNQSGQYDWLILKSEPEMHGYFEVARDNEVEQSVVTALEQRSAMPMMISEQVWDTPVEEWLSLMVAANKVPAVPGYYYALVSDEKLRQRAQSDVVGCAL